MGFSGKRSFGVLWKEGRKHEIVAEQNCEYGGITRQP